MASQPITVAGPDVTGLALVTAPAGTAKGRITFEGGIPAGLSTGTLTVMLAPLSNEMQTIGGLARVRDDLTFEATGAFGRRVLRAQPPAGWWTKSVTLNGQDVTDTGVEFKPAEELTGFEIVLTRTMATLTGTVTTAKGQPTTDYVVVAFAADSAKWGPHTRFVRSARPDQSGTFTIRGLPANDYLVVALEYLEPGEESDPEVLERLKAQATAVTVDDGETKTMTLKIK